MQLPSTTLVDRNIPLQKIFSKASIPAEQKAYLKQEILKITWYASISPERINVERGNRVEEIEVLLIDAISIDVDLRWLHEIEAVIPYPILFLVRAEDKIRMVITYRPRYAIHAGHSSPKTFISEWMPESDVPCYIAGSDIDIIYENFIKQVAGQRLDAELPLPLAINKAQRIASLEARLHSLNNKLNKEKQFNMQVTIKHDIEKLMKEINEYSE